jgi:hypothetical protein
VRVNSGDGTDFCERISRSRRYKPDGYILDYEGLL